MEQFIREKIKDKPLNKKRLAKKAGTAAPVSYTHLDVYKRQISHQ